MPERTYIQDQQLDEERALYGLRHATLSNVTFAGPADGESALKECVDIAIEDSLFELRYPMWHIDGLSVAGSTLTDTCRAAPIEAEYAFLDSRDLRLVDTNLTGKYSFQYVENLVIEGGVFDTKDAFWHARNVTVRNAVLKGEYLGWYSEGLTLEHCRIEGTQPLVNCRNLTLVDCEMANCDLAFEGSDVQATVRGHVDSIRDPRSGRIEVESLGQMVHDTVAGCGAQVIVRN